MKSASVVASVRERLSADVNEVARVVIDIERHIGDCRVDPRVELVLPAHSSDEFR